jgi:Ca2+/Na+ antiporter
MSSLADLSGSRNLEENLLHPSDLAEAARTTRQPSILSPRKRLRSRGTLLLVRTVTAISRGSRPPMLKSIPSVMEPEQQNSYAAAELVVPPPALLDGSRRMLAGNRLYVLLVAVPVALAAKPLGCSDGVVFGLCCFGILPLAALLGDATEQVALHTNETLSGLLNATFGNATELIVAICALNRGLLAVVQTSLLGSILSNTLLVLGCACLAGGVVTPAPRFNTALSALRQPAAATFP